MAQKKTTKRKKSGARSSTRRPASTRRKRSSAPRAAAKKRVRSKEPAQAADAFPAPLEAGSVEATLARVREEVAHWVKKGRYTKVRFKFRGKQLLPDLPVGAVLAAEALSFWWAGLPRALLANLGAQALLEVEMVSAADEEVGRGKAALLAGDLERARQCFEKALEMDRDSAAAHLNLGIAHKLQGDARRARELLQKAEQLAPHGQAGDEARRLLDQMTGPTPR